MPIFDIECYNCGKIEKDIWLKMEEKPSLCLICGGKRFKHVGGRFKLAYNNKTDMCDWEGNSSRYWNDVKAARDRGEKVKGITEI